MHYSPLWHGLPTVPRTPTVGLHALFISSTASWRPSVEPSGTVRRPCHSADPSVALRLRGVFPFVFSLFRAFVMEFALLRTNHDSRKAPLAVREPDARLWSGAGPVAAANP